MPAASQLPRKKTISAGKIAPSTHCGTQLRARATSAQASIAAGVLVAAGIADTALDTGLRASSGPAAIIPLLKVTEGEVWVKGNSDTLFQAIRNLAERMVVRSPLPIGIPAAPSSPCA